MSRSPFAFVVLSLLTAHALAEPPRAVDDRLEITLFAEHPTIVTPTGIDVDHAGRVWAIESNTHFPPDGYQRHDSDRLYVMQDTNGDGRADDVKVFADGFTHTMSVAVRPVWLPPVKSRGSRVESQKGEDEPDSGPGPSTLDPGLRQVFLAERSTIWLLEDLDDDLECDRRTNLIRLETPGNYPHNGLAGFAFDAMGWMYFGFGENLGAKYTLHGSDGTKLSGGGEGGNVYRCRPDGSRLQLWATGFWNPHASCVDAFGRLFTVDNDPDSRPPCRLLHVIEGGDYGFKFKNGRKGLHPFTSWNGEIPGTLPMVAGTGEAPSGIVAYESDGLPKDYLGNLLVTSWGDHRIDRFRLEPKGASFTSVAEPIVQGDDEFRPVGLATAPDGSLYCTDWVKRDYKLHGHGRIWRISWKDRPATKVVDVAGLGGEMRPKKLAPLTSNPRLPVRRVACLRLAESELGRSLLLNCLSNPKSPKRRRVESLWAAALVPKTTHDFDFMRVNGGPSRIAATQDEVELTIADLLGRTPQFPFELKSGRVFEPKRDPFIRAAHDNSALSFRVAYLLKYVGLIKPDKNSRNRFEDVDDHSSDPFLLRRLITVLAEASLTDAEVVGVIESESGDYREEVQNLDRMKIAFSLGSRLRDPTSNEVVQACLSDESAPLRRVAVQWAAEENLKDLRPQVAAVLESSGVTPDLFRATIAALQMLDGVDPKEIDRTPPTQYVMSLVRDTKRPANVRALALRMLGDGAGRDPKAKFDAALARELLAADSPEVRLETLRTLQTIGQPFASEIARSIATDDEADASLRAEAVVALGTQPTDADRDVLLDVLKADDGELRREALRSLRPLVKSDEVVATAVGAIDDAELREAVALARGKKPGFSEEARLPEGGDAAAGRRLFFHASGPGCAKCHTVGGRGGNVGPDLSLISRTMNREKLAESILEPSKEVAPQFTNWTFVMTDGKVRNGMILRQTRKLYEIGTPEGEVVEFSSDLVETRSPQKTSVMPAKLHERMTTAEFRDLLAYLESLK